MADLHLPVHGEHMARNAALALAAVEAFRGGSGLAPDLVAEGLAEVELPARLELMRREPPVLVDTAHNPHGVRATLATVLEAYQLSPLVGVVAMMRDKDVDQVMALLAEVLDRVVVTTVASTDRGVPVEELADRAEAVFGAGRVDRAVSVEAGLETALGLADEAGPGAGILVIGSVIAAGEARALLLPAKLRETSEQRTDALLRVGPSRDDIPSLGESDQPW